MKLMVNWKRNPFVLGLLIGWLVGILWWTVLMIAFGPSTVVTVEHGEVVDGEAS